MDRRDFLKGATLFAGTVPLIGVPALVKAGVPEQLLSKVEEPALIKQSSLITPNDLFCVEVGRHFDFLIRWKDYTTKYLLVNAVVDNLEVCRGSTMEFINIEGSRYRWPSALPSGPVKITLHPDRIIQYEDD